MDLLKKVVEELENLKTIEIERKDSEIKKVTATGDIEKILLVKNGETIKVEQLKANILKINKVLQKVSEKENLDSIKLLKNNRFKQDPNRNDSENAKNIIFIVSKK